MSDRNSEHHERDPDKVPDEEPFEAPHEPHENPNLDPNPHQDPDLEAGGGVKRGHTPPESQSASATPEHTPSARPPRSNVMLIVLAIIAVLLVLIFVAYGIGLWDS